MKIINRKAFFEMPAGTIYAQGEPWCFGELCVKGETLDSGDDWLYRQLVQIDADNSDKLIDRLDDMLDNGASYPLNTYEMRDGCFDDGMIFMVYEASDLKQMIDVFTVAGEL